MDVERELERVTTFVRGLLTGHGSEFDVIDRREIEAARKRPLADLLAELERDGLKIRGTRGNRVEDVLDLFEAVRTQMEVSKAALAQLAGISRGHVSELFNGAASRPTLDTVIRLSVALDYPLSIVDADSRGDDVEPPPRRRRRSKEAAAEEMSPTEVPRDEPDRASPLFWIVVTNGLSLVGGILLGGYLRTRKPAKKGGA